MNDSIEIRDTRPEDSSRVAELITQLGYPTSAVEMRARMEAIAARPEYRTWVAVQEGDVVGVLSACLGVYLEKSGVYGRVLALVVDDRRRGAGIGGALLERAESFFRGAHAIAVIVTSAKHRERAHRFYVERGYELTGVRLVKPLR